MPKGSQLALRTEHNIKRMEGATKSSKHSVSVMSVNVKPQLLDNTYLIILVNIL